MKLDFQPVVAARKVDVVANGENPHPGVPQVFQLHQAAAVAAGEAGEVLDDENVELMRHQPPAHGLVTLPLLEGVARAVSVFKKGQGAPGKPGLDEVGDDGLLIFNGHIVPIQLLVHRDSAVAGDFKGFGHACASL